MVYRKNNNMLVQSAKAKVNKTIISHKLNKPNKLNKSIKIKKIKLNNSDESICNCHKCISLQRRHVN
jgi:hypothetical protein